MSSEQSSADGALSSAVPHIPVPSFPQEKRMSKATEVMMQYVENLKRTYEKDHAELMEFKKLANQNSSRSCGPSGKNKASVLIVRSGPQWLLAWASGIKTASGAVSGRVKLLTSVQSYSRSFTTSAPVRLRVLESETRKTPKASQLLTANQSG